MGYTIKHDVEWPGQLHGRQRPLTPSMRQQRPTLAIYPDAGHRVSWTVLREALERLPDGETLILQTDIEYIPSARQAVYAYGGSTTSSFQLTPGIIGNMDF